MTKPTISLQESILAVLGFVDNGEAAAIASQVTPDLFDDDFRLIAQRVLQYRHDYSCPPGRAHMDDLFADQKSEGGKKSRPWLIMFDLANIAPDLNPTFVLNSVSAFRREQTLKGALIAASSRWEQGGQERSADIENILYKALKTRIDGFDGGLFFNDTSRALSFLDRYQHDDGMSFGIPEFDTRRLKLRPKEMTLYIAPKGSGKTWACIWVAKQAFKLGRRVLHITCEVSEEVVAERYFQCFIAAGTSAEQFQITNFDIKGGRLVDAPQKFIQPEIVFSAPGARELILQEIKSWNGRAGKLVVKDFPSGTLTLSMLENYLDYLDSEHHFNPDLLIVDYPDLMKQDIRNFRHSLGQTFVDLRGLLKTRHMAGFFPTQGNRSSLSASQVRSDMVSEDITKVNTADNVLTFSQTEDEKEYGTARIFVNNARNVRDGFTVCITQSYSTGQFIRETVLMDKDKSYWLALRKGKDAPPIEE